MEVMIVTALVGIMGTIAVNNWNSFIVRSRTSEAKVALSRIYSAERTFFLDSLSFTACLKSLGAMNLDPNRHYFSGFPNPPPAPVCGVGSNYLCTASRFDGTPPGTADACNCVNVVSDPDLGDYHGCASFPTRNLNPGLSINLTSYGLGVTKSTFTAGSIGAIKAGGALDVWTIDDKKVVKRAASGE